MAARKNTRAPAFIVAYVIKLLKVRLGADSILMLVDGMRGLPMRNSFWIFGW